MGIWQMESMSPVRDIVVPLLSSDVSILEDALSDGEEFQVMPRPADMSIVGDGVPVEKLEELGSFADFIALESKQKKLHSFYTEKELNSCLTKMYRFAKTSVDEHGLDMPKIFAIVRRAVINLSMWNDIHSSSAFLENNKIVHSLIT